MKLSILSVLPDDSPFLQVFAKSIDNALTNGAEISEIILYIYKTDNKPIDINLISSKIPIYFYEGANVGFGSANNLIASKATGDFLFFLNPDARIKTFDIVEIKNLCANNEIVGLKQEVISKKDFFKPISDTIAINHEFQGLSVDFFLNASLTKKSKSPMYADGAGLIVNKDAFEHLGGFAEDYFLFVEDVEFSIRARMMGFSIAFTSKSCVQHISGGFIEGGALKGKNLILNPERRYWTQKNQLKTALRLFSIPTLIFWIPVYVISNLFFSLILIFSGKIKFGLVFFSALMSNLKEMENTLVQRGMIQYHREKNDLEFFSRIRLIPTPLLIIFHHLK